MKKSHQIIMLTFAVSMNIQSTLSYAAELNTDEEKIVRSIQRFLPQSLNLLEETVNINSGTMNFDGVKQVGEIMIEQLASLDFDVHWKDGNAFNRAGHVIATKLSNNPNAPKILMIGHLDTVFAKHDNFQLFMKIDNKMISGPGIIDDKGGNVIIVSALRALKEVGVLDGVSIKVVLTGDEENSGRPLSLSKKDIIEGGKWANIALGFENGDSDINTAMVARRGYVSWELYITAKPAHSSQIFSEDIGYGAIFEAARILTTFRDALSSQKNLTFNPGIFVGGTVATYQAESSSGTAFGKANVIAKEAKVIGDIRALSVEQVTSAQLEMKKISSQSLAHTKATITFNEGYPPMSPQSGNYDLLSLYSKVSTDLGYNKVVATNPRKAGAADISFAANYVDMALDGMGLMGCCGHTNDEMADIASLQKNIEKAAILIYRLSKNKNN